MSECEIKTEGIKEEPLDSDDSIESNDEKNYYFKRKIENASPFENINFEVKVNIEDINEILDRKRAKEQLPLATIENLRNLVIKLRHKVLPQHRIERAAGSHVPTIEENNAMAKLMPMRRIKKGIFTPSEDQLIIDNWKAFCKMHDWEERNPKPFLYMRHSTTFYLKHESERKKFVQFLADGLPRRTLYSVYHRFRILYDAPKLRSKYSSHEDECIINYIERNQNVDKTRMFADLAEALNRTRASVWRRYRLLRKKRESGSDDVLQ